MKSLSILLVFVFPLFACSKQEPPIQKEALSALGKIKAATEVGVSYQQYGLLLIEAKAKVNEALVTVKDAPSRLRLSQTMELYMDAGQIWAEKIKGHENIFVNAEPGKTLIPKWKIATPQQPYYIPPGWAANSEEARSYLWTLASMNLTPVPISTEQK